MTQKRSYKQYPKEFKDEAVALVLDQGYSVPEAAKSLGIAPSMLYKWKEFHEQQAEGQALAEDEREELKRLRKEVKELRMEKDILKKASVDSTGRCNTLYLSNPNRRLHHGSKGASWTVGRSEI